jgi:hypothetical protein
LTACPECGTETIDPAGVCTICGKKIPEGSGKRLAQADMLMKMGAIIFIFGLFLPILFVTGGVIFGAGGVIWLMYRH